MKTIKLVLLILFSIAIASCGGGVTIGTTPVTGIPSATTGVMATAGNGQATISWTAVSGATSYNLYMATQSGVTKSNYTTLTGGMAHAGVTSPYAHTGLTNGTAYYYVVTAVNASGESAESAQVSGTPAAAASLVGTWGEVTLDHNNGGTWSTEVCKFTYNSNNTGASTCQWNDGGTLQTGAPDTFTYTVVSNPDGSLTITKTFASDGSTKTHHWVIGDDGKVRIVDGTTRTVNGTTLMNKQRFRIAVKLDTAKTYTNADLSGDYYLERYRYNGSYVAFAALSTFDGVGGRNYSLTTNADGVISADTGPIVGTYNVSSDGLYTIDNANTGYLLGDGKFGVNTHVNDPATWSFGLSMKKGDKTYSTADLAGTWAYIKFGDDVGTSFRSMIGTMICNSTGNCSHSEKYQIDGSVSYEPFTATLSVASNGGITDSIGPSMNLAIGNNGNTIIFNNSFDTSNSGKRRIGVFVKCSACLNLATTLMGGSMQGHLNLANTVTTFAGAAGSAGSTDGTGSAARFNEPRDITTDGVNLYVLDKSNHTIRKVVIATGAVTTLAGSAGVSGSADGTGTAARFNTPKSITTDGTNLYVGDSGNSTIRKVVIATGVVTTIAGSAGVAGSTDGTGTAARFNGLSGITTDGTNLYVGDAPNNTIRKVVIATGVVTTIAGSAGVAGSTDGTGTAALFNHPIGVTTDGTNLYVLDTDNHTIRKMVIATGVVTTIAGNAGVAGSTDGTDTAARFNTPGEITMDGTNLYVSDELNSTIRKMVIATGVVTTIAGNAGAAGSTDGTGTAARFNTLRGITTDGTNLYVADMLNHTIRKIQ